MLSDRTAQGQNLQRQSSTNQNAGCRVKILGYYLKPSLRSVDRRPHGPIVELKGAANMTIARKSFCRFLYSSLFAFGLAGYPIVGHTHICGPSEITVDFGRTAVVEITADVSEGKASDYFVRDISANAPFDIVPASDFDVVGNGEWKVTGTQIGSGSAVFHWFYPPNAVGAQCPTTINVVPVGSTVPSSANEIFSGRSDDPVNTRTGEFVLTEAPDLFLRGPLPLVFQRYYAGRLFEAGTGDTSIGKNWSHNYQTRILQQNDTQVEIAFLQGRRLLFLSSGGDWVLDDPADLRFQLVEVGSDWLLLDPRTHLSYRYNSKGQLISIADRAGNQLSMTYGDGFEGEGDTLVSVSDGLGRELRLSFGTNGPQAYGSVTDGTRTVNYSLGFSKTLNQVTDVRGNTTVYEYENGFANPRLTRITRPNGNIEVENIYDSEQRVSEQRVGGLADHATTFSYGDTTIMTDPPSGGSPRVRSHGHTGSSLSGPVDGNGQALAVTSDAAGRPASVTDRLGQTTHITTDADSGRTTRVDYPDGSFVSLVWTASESADGLRFFDLTEVRHRDATQQLFSYDENGNLLERTDRAGEKWLFTYNGRGQLLTETSPVGGVTTYVYDAAGNRTSETDPRGNQTQYSYDGLHRLLQIRYADDSVRQFEFDSADHVTRYLDEGGNETLFAFDANGNIVETTDALGNSSVWQYDGLDRVISSENRNGETTANSYFPSSQLDKLTLPNNAEVSFSYDQENRIVGLSDSDGAPYLEATFNPEGELAETTRPVAEAVTLSVDELGRVAQQTTASGHNTSFEYDPNGGLSTITDALGRESRFTINARGRYTEITLPGGVSASYTRDALGAIVNATDPNGNNWSRGYDTGGFPLSTTDPLGNRWQYQFDSRNRLANTTFPSGATLARGYDASNNLLSKNYSSGLQFSYSYDELGRLTQGSTSGSADLSLEYDQVDRLVENNGIETTRDALGRITSIQYASGKAISYSYDARGRLTSIQDWTGGSLALSHDGNDRVTQISYPNGVVTTPTFDDRYQLTGADTPGVMSISLTRDALGRVATATRHYPDEPGVSTSRDDSVEYNQASEIASTGYSYDANGQLTSAAEERSYQWDAAGRLVSATEGGVSEAFIYDSVASRIADGDADYIINSSTSNSVVATEQRDGNPLWHYIYSPAGSLLYRIHADSGARQIYHFDEAGNVIALTDDGGNVIQSYSYSPYGMLASSTGEVENPFTYRGEIGWMASQFSGLYYAHARWYDANTGQFLSRDPDTSTDPRRFASYGFALGDPINRTDFGGRHPALAIPLFFAVIDGIAQQSAQDTARRLAIVRAVEQGVRDADRARARREREQAIEAERERLAQDNGARRRRAIFEAEHWTSDTLEDLEDRAEREADAERGYSQSTNAAFSDVASALFEISSNDGCNRLVLQLENLFRAERNAFWTSRGDNNRIEPLIPLGPGESPPDDETLDEIARQIDDRFGFWDVFGQNRKARLALAKFGPCEEKLMRLLSINDYGQRVHRRGLNAGDGQ